MIVRCEYCGRRNDCDNDLCLSCGGVLPWELNPKWVESLISPVPTISDGMHDLALRRETWGKWATGKVKPLSLPVKPGFTEL